MRRFAGLVLAFALAACASPPATPPAPVPAGNGISLVSTPVPLNPDKPDQDRIGRFVYAGGVALTSDQTSRLHGLSDLKILPDGTVMAISDEGDFFQAKLQVDAAGRFTGLTDGKLEPLTGLDGKPLQGKEQGDAEGLAVMPNGDRLVSFEQDHRIWLYPAAGGPPRAVPKPATLFSANEGMEALSQYPSFAPDAYIVGGEEGEMWVCRLAGACVSIPAERQQDQAFGLTAVSPFQDGSIVILHRAFDAVRGVRLIVSIIVDPRTKPRVIDSFTLAAPYTRDNFEGAAVVSNAAGGIRIFILADDNFDARERTLMMAFDWTPNP
ncbi:hypothetical protein QO010_004118 [Caulobacter ginsengisoli]|uniref:Phytase-like domain-containing protein n=1 Tax=Caulobacter ginsengisoli TaxID=400775 RepID=A0ABU0IWF3_9CAUL|nr:esterase-like activity of phytase family protein [Caulobacter ginsengisoli]MDQ0466325.1 hypothetical protein [Caulobacter ginsengisoli]